MLNNFLKHVQGAGLQIDTVYDIGACQAQWTRNTRHYAIPTANFILFEANPAYKETLESSEFLAFCGMALSNPGRESVEFYNGTNTGDSYYKETTKHYDNQGAITLPCTTLDIIKEQADLPTPQFIKIDTQGSELDILSGASFLKDVDLIYTECPIVRYNAGAPDIQDYLDFFKAREFIPVDVFEIHKFEHTLIQLDIMFMRRETKDRIFGANEYIRPFA